MSFTQQIPQITHEQYILEHEEEPYKCSTVGYWVGIIFLLIALIIFIILFIIVWRDKENCESGLLLLDIPGAKITVSAAAITGTWDSTVIATGDTITLYASTNPIKIDSDGKARGTVASTTTTSADTLSLAVGSTHHSVIIAPDQTYYTALVGSNTVSSELSETRLQYAVFNDIVYTQGPFNGTISAKFLPVGPFNIESLNQKGAITSSGSYSNNNADHAVWNYNPTNNTIVLNVDDEEEDPTILCVCSNTVVAATVDGSTVSSTSALCANTTLDLNKNCGWQYNVGGLNQWCQSSGNFFPCMHSRIGSKTVTMTETVGSSSKWANVKNSTA